MLSLTGTLTAADGDAMGLTSTDIGVEETLSTTEGTSLQLTGDGTSYEDFTWTSGTTQSFGAVNRDMSLNGACPVTNPVPNPAPTQVPMPAPTPTQINGTVANVFLSELHYDNVGADIGKP